MEPLKSHVQGDYALAVSCEKIRDLYSHLRRHNVPQYHKDEERDIKALKARYAAEGIGHLTITLPKLDDEFVRVLSGTSEFSSKFLRPVWGLAKFWRETALSDSTWVPDDNVIRTIRIVRSILKGFKKFELPPTEEQLEEKVEQFKETERSVREFNLPDSMLLFRAQRICEDFFEGAIWKEKGRNIRLGPYVPRCPRPRHGPGAVADGKKANEKWCFSTLYDSVHQHWPYYDYYFGIRGTGDPAANNEVDMVTLSQEGSDIVCRGVCKITPKATRAIPTALLHNIHWFKSLKRVPSPVSRLVFVPKDSRGPRTITCEPSELMWMQQGVLKGLVRFIELHPWTKGHVNFADQTINAVCASQGARDNSLATIDLKDASDRVSAELVHYLVPKRISDKWFALRSTHTTLPDGEVFQLAKFAAMGSALCFPVEALVFWALCVAALEERGLTREGACAAVYVYGDDIIVPNEHAVHVMDALESVNLVVNRAKSFYGTEFFRESCGTDSFKGVSVTPICQKTPPPSRPSDGNAITAMLAQASLLWELMPYTAHFMLRTVEDVLEQPVPRVPHESEMLAVVVPPDQSWTIHDWIATHRLTWYRDHSYLATKALVVKTKRTKDKFASSWSRLLNALTCTVESDPETVVDRSSTQIRRRLVQVPLR